MKWRDIIDEPLFYYGLAFINWVLLPHLYLNLMEVVLSRYRPPDITKIVPAWNYIMLMVTCSYAALICYIRSRYTRGVSETNAALIFAVLGCLLIPMQIARIRESTRTDGSLDDTGLRILVGSTIPAQLCVIIAALTLGSLLLKRLKFCERQS